MGRHRERRRRGLAPEAPAPDTAPEPVTVPDAAQSTAAALIRWVDEAPSDNDMILRAEAARAINDRRAKPWATVTKAVDGILG